MTKDNKPVSAARIRSAITTLKKAGFVSDGVIKVDNSQVAIVVTLPAHLTFPKQRKKKSKL